MKRDIPAQIEFQRNYYKNTAGQYDEAHVNVKDEHYLAASLMIAAIDFFGICSILDIGSGTGRIVSLIKEKRPGIHIVGIEPVAELREVGYRGGLSTSELVSGDALALQFADEEFDLVCEFGVLHHINAPKLVISEMLRVSKMAIFISDSNNFGQGSLAIRKLKQIINNIGLWKLADLIKTKGRGFSISEGDGLAYSYSVFNDYKQIEAQCGNIHLMNTMGNGVNIYKNASHIALLGVKK